MISPYRLLPLLQERKQQLQTQLQDALPSCQTDDQAFKLYKRLISVRLEELERITQLIKKLIQ